MEDHNIKSIVPYQPENIRTTEKPSSILGHINSAMPHELEIWDEFSPRGDRIKKDKEFDPIVIGLEITKTAESITSDPGEQKKLINQIIYIYDIAFEKLSIPKPSDPNARTYDLVPTGLVDRFFVEFPLSLRQAAEGKTNGHEIVTNILDIISMALNKIENKKEESLLDRLANKHIPFNVSDVCNAAINLTLYAKGGTDESAKAKLKFISAVKQDQIDSAEFNSRDLRLYGERAKFIVEANHILNDSVDTLIAFNNYTLHLAKYAPQLFIDIEKDSFINIALAARDIADLSATTPEDVISKIEEHTFEIAKKDNVAAIIFVKYGPKALAKASRSRGYNFDNAKEFLTLTSNYLCVANDKRGLVEGRFIDNNIGGFLEDGLIDYILATPVDEFAKRILDDHTDSRDGFAAERAAHIRNTLNIVMVADLISKRCDKTLTPQERFDFYREIIKLDKTPYGNIRLYKALINQNLEGVHLPNNSVAHLTAVLEIFANSENNLQEEINLGLIEMANGAYLASLSFETGLLQDQQIFALYVTGLGILNKSMLYRMGDKKFIDFLPQPDIPEGRTMFFIAIANLGKIYAQAKTEPQKDRINELIIHVLKDDQLRIPFFVHLYQSANFETLESLSWVTRLSKTKNNIGHRQEGEFPSLAHKVNTFLSIQLLDPNFRLSEKRHVLQPGIQNNNQSPYEENGLSANIDASMPLGRAIGIIASSDENPETLQQVANALADVHLHSIEDAKTLAEPIISSFIRFLDLDPSEVNSQMFAFISGDQIVEELNDVSPTAAMVVAISSFFGTGPLSVLSYSPDRNAIIIAEDYPNGYTIDGLGEEIMHWVRRIEGSDGQQNAIVDEFWGFIGRRVARSTLGTNDVNTSASSFEGQILASVEKILEVEVYHNLNVGYERQLGNIFLHAIGYEAGSNIDITDLPKDLIRQSNDYILQNFIKKYGPNEDWFIEIIGKVRDFYKKYSTENGITNTSIDDILEPMVKVLDMLPYLDREKIGI